MELSNYNDLLYEASEIYKRIPRKEKTFMDISGYPHYENVCSNILAFYFNPLEEHNLNNLVMIRCNALDIDKVFDHEIDHIYLNFSDPWPKTRHHLRRLSSKVFLEKYDYIFKSENIIEMRTDNRDLFEYSLVSFSEYGYTLNNVSLDYHKDNAPDITTEYEDRFTKDGLPIYYLLCTRKPLKKRK